MTGIEIVELDWRIALQSAFLRGGEREHGGLDAGVVGGQ